jgi:hypothetical protein
MTSTESDRSEIQMYVCSEDTGLDLARRAPESPDKVAIIAELQKYTARGDRFTLTSGIAIQGKQGYAQPRSIKSMELETLKGWLV